MKSENQLMSDKNIYGNKINIRILALEENSGKQDGLFFRQKIRW